MANSNGDMPSCLDRQISKAEEDAFGHRHFAQALRSLIETEKHSPPFSIGLLGGWGTGKSTIKDLYVSDLANDTQRPGKSLPRSELFFSITFNAWRFGGKEQDIKRALLRHVFRELGGNEEDLQDRLFRQIGESFERPKTVPQYICDFIKAWALPIPALLLSMVVLLAIIGFALLLLPLEDDISKSILIFSLTIAYTYLQKFIGTYPVAAGKAISRIEMPVTSAEQYEDLFLKQLCEFKTGKSSLGGKKGIACKRLIVFVDDLDRLSAEEMVLGLDAVRTFMEIPSSRLPNDIGLVFVISCDEARVADALAKGRRHGDLPGTVFTQSDARRYLDRIFQFRLDIPPFPRQDMRLYAKNRLTSQPRLESELADKGVTIDNLVDRMIHVGVQNPRNALQIINAFSQAWWLARKRETEELGTDRPGGLYEGAVTNHPISLGALSAIRVNFPDFYADLQNDPSLVNKFTDVIVRGKLLKEQPLSVQQLLLERYLEDQKENNSQAIVVRKEHRSLRQYLSSLVGLRWPESLQPLLLLSVDPITRKFGPKASEIYDALVSGDTTGVLERLGRRIDTSQLKEEDAYLLMDMTESLQHESESIRVNASRVIAELVDRYPDTIAKRLLSRLCRELDDSRNLRSQLGIEKIRKVLTTAHSEDQQAVASRLIEDVLTIDEDVKVKLETMETPSLDEAVKIARGVVAIVLPIRQMCGLDVGADKQLLRWLAKRNVRIEGSHYQLPFEEFELWLDEHEDNLLPELMERYTEILADELEKESTPSFNVSKALSRAQRVFDMLPSAGARQILWQQLIRYVNVHEDAAVLAGKLMVNYVEKPDAKDISNFIVTLVDRLESEADLDYPDSNFDEISPILLTIVRERRADLEEVALTRISTTADFWSNKEYAGKFSCDIAKELLQVKPDEIKPTLDKWASRILQDLPIECSSLLAAEYLNLEDSTQSALVTALNFVVKNDNIDEAMSQKFRLFVENVRGEAWRTPLLKEYLDRLVSQLAARHNNPNQYLIRIFPAVTQVLFHASPTVLGTSLQDIFQNAKGQPHLPQLYSCMNNYWPKPAEDLAPYDPILIFTAAVEHVTTQPKTSTSGLLNSLRDMIVRDIIPSEQDVQLIEAACITWTVNPKNSISIIRNGIDNFTPKQAANLIDPIDWSNEEQQSLLSVAWVAIAESQNSENRIQTAKLLLDKGAIGPPDEPDRALQCWLDLATGIDGPDMMRTLITEPNLTDPHRRRLWSYAVHSSNSLGAEFFIEIIPEIVQLSPVEGTATAVFDSYDEIYTALGSIQNRADLAQKLMAAFPNASTKTIKAKVAEWCNKLSGDASLHELNSEILTETDIEVLSTYFNNSSTFKAIKREIKSKKVAK